MSDKEEFEKLMLYGIEGEISFKKCIENEIVFIFFSLLFIAIEFVSGRRNYVFITLCVLPALFYLASVRKLLESRIIQGTSYILHNGIIAGCFSFLFGLFGLETLLFLFSGKERIIMLCIASTGYIFVIMFFCFIMKQFIKKKKHSGQRGVIGTISFTLCAVSGVIGGIVARTFLKDIDNGTAMGILCILLFFLSYLTFMGMLNLFKYQYIMRHPDISE